MQDRAASLCICFARKPFGPMVLRKVLGKREAHIISRLKNIAGMPTSMIAKVTERDKKSIYNVLKGKVKFAKRGPKEKLQRQDVAYLVKTFRSISNSKEAESAS